MFRASSLGQGGADLSHGNPTVPSGKTAPLRTPANLPPAIAPKAKLQTMQEKMTFTLLRFYDNPDRDGIDQASSVPQSDVIRCELELAMIP